MWSLSNQSSICRIMLTDLNPNEICYHSFYNSLGRCDGTYNMVGFV